ncbi:hypothetical protein [Catelliglobosispora koreensis]|nr:hypothetical protein [Catelliglobosispora koreensis]
MVHVIDQNSSVAQLAALPLEHVARRDDPGLPWTIEEFEWEPDP